MVHKKAARRTQLKLPSQPTQVRFSLQDSFDQFLRAKRLEQLKPRTLEDHQRHFSYLMRWLSVAQPQIRYPEDITADVVRDYVDFMLRPECEQIPEERKEGSMLSPVTVNVRLRTLKCLFRWMSSEGICSEDPTKNIKLLRTESDTIHGFTKEQVALLLTQPDLSTYVGFRDRTLMLLLLDTGARIQEVLTCKTSQIDFPGGSLRFGASVTKTRKSRTVPISQQTVNALRELLAENEENFGADIDHIFLSLYGRSLDPSSIRERLRGYGRQAGISQACRVSPHTFRHTFARLYIRNGGDVFTLQKILGHSTMEMVRKYVQMEQSDIHQAHSKFSPLNNFMKEIHM